MEDLVTPKQVARAIGVSESSLKRWCDRGLIETVRTAGGHRRLRLGAVIRYLRETGQPLMSPEALGLPRASGRGERVLERGRDRLQTALLAGDELVVRQIVLDLYLARHPLPVIFDQAIAAAFESIGNLWACHEAEVYQERRACEITLRLLHELRRLLPNPPDSHRALGGTLEGDPYTLPTTMAELVLREMGWTAVSLGASLPADSLMRAVDDLRPKLVWLSVSHIADLERFVADFSRLREAVQSLGATLVIGGYALKQPICERLQDPEFCADMRCLHAIAERLQAGETPSA